MRRVIISDNNNNNKRPFIPKKYADECYLSTTNHQPPTTRPGSQVAAEVEYVDVAHEAEEDAAHLVVFVEYIVPVHAHHRELRVVRVRVHAGHAERAVYKLVVLQWWQ